MSVSDPKHLAFVLARYHFVARMLQNAEHVLEVGCGSMVGASIIRQAVHNYTGIDCNPDLPSKDYAAWQLPPKTGYVVADILRWPLPLDDSYDAVFALDVLEHIQRKDEETFFTNINRLLRRHGVVIIGVPSQESQTWASPPSRALHVNCKTENGLRDTLRDYYHNVFVFGMNDTTLHTGYGPLCHYRLAICCGPRT